MKIFQALASSKRQFRMLHGKFRQDRLQSSPMWARVLELSKIIASEWINNLPKKWIHSLPRPSKIKNSLILGRAGRLQKLIKSTARVWSMKTLYRWQSLKLTNIAGLHKWASEKSTIKTSKRSKSYRARSNLWKLAKISLSLFNQNRLRDKVIFKSWSRPRLWRRSKAWFRTTSPFKRRRRKRLWRWRALRKLLNRMNARQLCMTSSSTATLMCTRWTTARIHPVSQARLNSGSSKARKQSTRRMRSLSRRYTMIWSRKSSALGSMRNSAQEISRCLRDTKANTTSMGTYGNRLKSK